MNQLHDIPGDHQSVTRLAAVAGGSTAAVNLGPVPFKSTVTEAYFVPDSAITGHTTNYMTLQLTNRGSAGAGTTAVASLAFTNGVNGTAHDAKALTVDTALDDVAAGDVLSLDKSEAGTGLALLPAPPWWSCAPVTLAVAFCSGGSVEHEFCHSLAATLVLDASDRRTITNVIDVLGGAYIDRNRDAIVRAFLDADEDWLLMLDADMVWEPHQIYELLDSAHPDTRPIVGGLYFSGGRAGGPIWPLIGDLSPDGKRTTWRLEYRLGLEPCDATGGGFLLIHRTVLEALQQIYPDPFPWFEDQVVDGEPRGEDVVFCYRARGLGFPVYVDTRVDVGHKKAMYLNAAMYAQLLDAHRAKEATVA